MIFGTNIPHTTGHQTAVQFPTSPNIRFYTTWGKQNKRNMHWNEQQTSTNWRLDRIKIWSRRSEMKYIIYLLTTVLPAIKRVAGDTFVFQHSAPAHRLAKRSNCQSAKPQTSSLRICGLPNSPDLSPVDYKLWGIMQQQSIRRRSRMWMNSRSNRLKSGLAWSRTLLILLSTNGENVCCVRAKGRHIKQWL